ncbi:hypothetical protein KVT40_007398 [Elsinoe batatas]|uniref:Uncharacterized protein n=1 Tax=Elsinoe batatas TaxID=2601811 RepID=A0A8K0PC96_9PEZI|nr:hypothetical protein KVT40_007398 [Elsinoe batatas]
MSAERREASRGRRITRGFNNALHDVRGAAQDIRRRTHYRRQAFRWRVEDALFDSLDVVCDIIERLLARRHRRRPGSNSSSMGQSRPDYEEQNHSIELDNEWQQELVVEEQHRSGSSETGTWTRLESEREQPIRVLDNSRSTDQPIITWSNFQSWYYGRDARIQANPDVYDPITRTILQHEPGHVCCTTVQLDLSPGRTAAGFNVGNDLQVADYVHRAALNMSRSDHSMHEARLRTMGELMAVPRVTRSEEQAEHDNIVHYDRLTRWWALGAGPLG